MICVDFILKTTQIFCRKSAQTTCRALQRALTPLMQEMIGRSDQIGLILYFQFEACQISLLVLISLEVHLHSDTMCMHMYSVCCVPIYNICCVVYSPVFPGLFEFCSRYTGASLQGATQLNHKVRCTSCISHRFVCSMLSFSLPFF